MVLDSWLQDARRWATVTVCVFLLGSAWTFLSRLPEGSISGSTIPSSPREGFLAPDFTLNYLTTEAEENQPVTLSELRGQVVVINFWASWCPPCREEMPTLERIYQTYRDRGLVILGINATYQDSPASALAFIAEQDLSFPMLMDDRGTVSRRYLLRGLPSTYFVDRQGIIRSVVIGGPMSEALVRSKIQDLLEETP
jgi:thiol-disulfide isomerase/thioredoxin